QGLSRSALICTSTIALGQVIVYLSAISQFPSGLLLGYFITGIGISPVAIVQESIVLARSGSKYRGKSMALSLLIGKLGSGIASFIAVPLSDSGWGPNSPFAVSLVVSLCSVLSAMIFTRLEHKTIDNESESSPDFQQRSATKLKETVHFGDRFWVYVVLCAICGGLWFPLIHLSTRPRPCSGTHLVNLVRRSGLQLDEARPHTMHPTHASLSWTLFSVITGRHFSTALGIHKSIEMAGSTISQTVLNRTNSPSRSVILRGHLGLGITFLTILASWLSFLWAVIN
ncbi:hypothetical protein CROQUDRAFT_37444, partial [Cronartium quercuum f. sp. fusiforme G11]